MSIRTFLKRFTAARYLDREIRLLQYVLGKPDCRLLPPAYCHCCSEFTWRYWSDKYERSSYMPSKEDLSNLFYFREDIIKTLNLDGFPLGVISWVKGPSNIEMLVYQASLLSPTGYRTFMDYEACVKQCRSKEEITETLNDYGYKASFVNYSREGFSEDDKQKLNSFNLKLKSLNLNPTK